MEFHCSLLNRRRFRNGKAPYVFTMAVATDPSIVFYTKATPAQWTFVLSLYKDVLKLKAAQKKKKGGPEELIRLDNWYQEQLPKIIHSRKSPHIVHEELVQVMKWKLMRGKFRPSLIDLVRLNTETAVLQASKKAFRKLPNVSSAITSLTNLKGIGPASASAVLATAFPEHVPFMADESMLSTPGIESIDYTLAEYLNYAEQIKACADRLKKMDPEGKWNPHMVELTLWTHYLARELKPALLEGMPSVDAISSPATSNGKTEGHSENENKAENVDETAQLNDEDSSEDKVSSTSRDNTNNNINEEESNAPAEGTSEESNSAEADGEDADGEAEESDEPPSKKLRE